MHKDMRGRNLLVFYNRYDYAIEKMREQDACKRNMDKLEFWVNLRGRKEREPRRGRESVRIVVS
jgi:hypothetical protein